MTDLEELILFYEEEIASLQLLIKEANEEQEYKIAHFHQKALQKTHAKLQSLRILENPNYDQIAQLKLQKNNFELLTTKGSVNPDFLAYVSYQIQKFDSKLKALAALPKRDEIDGQEFDDAIFDLVADKYQHFRLHLNKAENIYLDFKKAGNYINLSIPNYKKIKKKHYLGMSKAALKEIGFRKDGKSLRYEYDISHFKDAIFIKTITSRVIYDLFLYYNFKQQTTLEIIK